MSTSSQATVVGLYGVSGCGKSYLLAQAKERLGEVKYAFYDGSVVIEEIMTVLNVQGGIAAFKKMNKFGRARFTELATRRIGKECCASGKVGIVAGHYLVCNQEFELENVWAVADAEV